MAKPRTQSLDLSSFTMIRYMEGQTYFENMRNITQKLSGEKREESYSCAFCDSVSKKLGETKAFSDLEALYLEHLSKYHGLIQ